MRVFPNYVCHLSSLTTLCLLHCWSWVVYVGSEKKYVCGADEDEDGLYLERFEFANSPKCIAQASLRFFLFFFSFSFSFIFFIISFYFPVF